MKRLYVGNLAPNTTAAEVEDEFSKFGRVLSVTFAGDRHSKRQRAFCYVEMEDGDSAAIAGLNRKDHRGHPLTVCSAMPKDAPTATSAATADPIRSTHLR